MEKLEPSAETVWHYSYLKCQPNKHQNHLLVSNKLDHSSSDVVGRCSVKKCQPATFLKKRL